jgi:hypothetical protein
LTAKLKASAAAGAFFMACRCLAAASAMRRLSSGEKPNCLRDNTDLRRITQSPLPGPPALYSIKSYGRAAHAFSCADGAEQGGHLV